MKFLYGNSLNTYFQVSVNGKPVHSYDFDSLSVKPNDTIAIRVASPYDQEKAKKPPFSWQAPTSKQTIKTGLNSAISKIKFSRHGPSYAMKEMGISKINPSSYTQMTVDKFSNEYQTMVKCKHPHIVDVYSYHKQTDKCIYVMQLSELGSLQIDMERRVKYIPANHYEEVTLVRWMK